MVTPLVEHGYVTCAINYRLAPKHVFPAQIDDCKSAVRWLRSHAQEFKVDILIVSVQWAIRLAPIWWHCWE